MKDLTKTEVAQMIGNLDLAEPLINKIGAAISATIKDDQAEILWREMYVRAKVESNQHYLAAIAANEAVDAFFKRFYSGE